MTFPANAYIAAFILPWVLAFGTLPVWRRLCLRWDMVDDPGHRKIHDTAVPLAGGITVLCALCATLMAGWLVLAATGSPSISAFPNFNAHPGHESIGHPPGFLLKYGFGKRVLELSGIVGGAAGMLLVGLLDDRLELRAGSKFAGQFLIALMVAACGVRGTLFVPSVVFSYLATILWILTVVNAFNFMDNMNGLCAGLGAVAAACFAGIAATKGQYLVALLGFATLGALLGFLPHNFPRARAFLGDSGSHLTGFLLAVMAILPHFHTSEEPRPLAVLTPLLVLAVPLADMAWVVLLRWRIGQPFYQGDTNHLSHRLVRAGLTRTHAVAVIWIIAGIFGGMAFLL